MYKKDRKFAVPFSQYAGYEVDDYFDLLGSYMPNIDSVFCGPSFVVGDHITPKNFLSKIEKDMPLEAPKYFALCDQRLFNFLGKSFGKFKRYITINNAVFPMSDDDKFFMFENNVLPMIRDFKVEGLILSDYNMACFVHKNYPDIEIHNSCNSFCSSPAEMENWRVNAGVSVFNLPRQACRSLRQLSEMREFGFKTKVLVNEACYFACTEMIRHCVMLNFDYSFGFDCLKGVPANILRGCYIKKEWYKYLDDYVDVYKLSGKTFDLESLKKCFDYYIGCKDVDDILDVLIGPAVISFRNQFPGIKIPPHVLSDKLLLCECKDCFRNCSVCSNVFSSLFYSSV